MKNCPREEKNKQKNKHQNEHSIFSDLASVINPSAKYHQPTDQIWAELLTIYFHFLHLKKLRECLHDKAM